MKQGRGRTLAARCTAVMKTYLLLEALHNATTSSTQRGAGLICVCVCAGNMSLIGCQNAASALLHVLLKVPYTHIQTSAQTDLVLPNSGHLCVVLHKAANSSRSVFTFFGICGSQCTTSAMTSALLHVLLKVPPLTHQSPALTKFEVPRERCLRGA